MKKINIIVSAVVVFVLLFGGVTGVAWAVYMRHSDVGIIRAISKTIPIPAAKVGDRTITYQDYLDSRDTIKIFLASDTAEEQGIVVPFDTELEKNILEKLVNEEALYDVSEGRGIEVSDSELQDFFNEVTDAASTTSPNIGEYLMQTYGWDEETFRQKILRPALFEEKLTASLTEEGQPDGSLAFRIQERLDRDDVKRYLRF
ncbi:MAG: SurA N-terminal domain-containing protein [bacterium]|nr:SurA N-terminal domain-containing protein [bacterium]